MDYFNPLRKDPAAQGSQEPEEEFPGGSVNKWYILLAALLIAGATVYGVRRWKHRGEAPAPVEGKPKPAKAAKPPPPQVFVGDTRERVVEVLGDPPGVSAVGKQEFLMYSNGQVTIENGVAVSVEIGKERQLGRVRKEDAQIILKEGGRILKQEP